MANRLAQFMKATFFPCFLFVSVNALFLSPVDSLKYIPPSKLSQYPLYHISTDEQLNRVQIGPEEVSFVLIKTYFYAHKVRIRSYAKVPLMPRPETSSMLIQPFWNWSVSHIMTFVSEAQASAASATFEVYLSMTQYICRKYI